MWEIEKIIKKGDYLYAIVRNHPNRNKSDYVLMHRVIVENNIGRILGKDEVVHHINGDKKDNRFENLEIMNSSEHNLIHYKQNYPNGKPMIDFVCENCGIQFKREKRNKQRGLRIFCSKKCSSKFYYKPIVGKFTKK